MKSGNHLKALMKKNTILFRRSCCCSLLEILVPACFTLFLVLIRNIVEIIPLEQKSYVDTAYTFNHSLTAGMAPQVKALYRLPYKDQTNFVIQQLLIYDHLKNCYNTQGGLIAVSPPGNFISTGLQTEFSQINFNTTFFDSTQKMEEYFTGPNYGDSQNPWICMGINIEESSNGKYTYRIRLNTTTAPTRREVFEPDQFDRTNPVRTEWFTQSDLWIKYGFISTQVLIDNLILKQVTSNPNAYIKPKLNSVKLPKYIKDDFATEMQGSTDLFLILPLILPFMRNVQRLLMEKEKKIKEGMKMMGMTNASFYLSWIFTYLFIYGAISLLVCWILVSKILVNSSFILLFLFQWLFGIVLIFQALFVSVFFTKVKQGLICSMIFFVFFYMVRTILNAGDVTYEARIWASLSPHTAMTLTYDSMLLFEGQQVGVNFGNFNQKFNNYNMAIGFLFQFINIFFYAIMSIYLDQVFPNEFGNKKHPLFFLDFLFKKKDKQLSKMQQYIGVQQNFDAKTIEPVDENLQNLEKQSKCVQIQNLSKIYPSGKKAVDNLSLNMYEGQIFALLGHNGAGKTSTISMITGLQTASDGTALCFGKSIQGEMDQIRQFMGVCPQHDILYDDLTVYEHLELFATFKGMEQYKIKEAVMKMIKDLDIEEKAYDLAKNLSGGQKRRLSVGIAFIGDSKLILLDEPTSGMDTSARRFVWEMLTNMKQDRVIILTTHFMDEADFIGDRIGIMVDGQLACCGSSIFLKNQFGVGYNLTVVKKNQDSNAKIINFVQKIISSAKVLSDVSAEISFQLPMSETSKFQDMFTQLDSQMDELDILQYGISITTLEEVFLKISNPQISEEESKKLKQYQDSVEQQDNFILEDVIEKSPSKTFWMHYNALVLKRLHYFKRDYKGLFCEIVLPILVIIFGLSLISIQFVKQSTPYTLNAQVFQTPLITRYSGSPANYQTIGNNMDKNHFTMVPQNVNDIYGFDDNMFQYWSRNNKGGYYITQSDSTNKQYAYNGFWQTLSPDMGPILINAMNQAIIRTASGDSSLQINVINHPMPPTVASSIVENFADGFISALVFSIALSFIPASNIVFLVKERSENIKHQQIVSGVSIFAYWAANYSVDFFKFMIVGFISWQMSNAFNIQTLNDGDNYSAFFVLHLLFGLSMISFTYLFQFIFKQYGSAQLMIFGLFFLSGSVGVLVSFILRLLASTRSTIKVLCWFFRFIPSYGFGFGLINMANAGIYSRAERTPLKGPYDIDISGGDFLIMGICSVLYMVLVFVIEFNSVEINFQDKKFIDEKLDEDVLQEQQFVQQTPPAAFQVCADKMRKVYSNGKVAVKQLSFGVKKGEVFGLLGVNGAGKTTSFKMLCGEHQPSSGNVYIEGLDCIKNPTAIRAKIGYCPQFDALLENLTCKEHLELYANIKKIPYDKQKELVQKKLIEMDLKKFEHVVAGTLSGGNKRKLSVAIAMLGNPPIIFLDEPSTGMDPGARRFMWDVISRVSTRRKQSCIILTTHSMEEAEALSTRLGIMVDGQFQCLGSIQHVKNKFGQGYEIEVKIQQNSQDQILQKLKQANIKENQMIVESQIRQTLQQLGAENLHDQITEHGYGQSLYYELIKSQQIDVQNLVAFVLCEQTGNELINFMKEKLGDFSIIEHIKQFYRFKLNAKVPIGKLFGLFEDNKSLLKINQYSIKQASIEQIFNNFAKSDEQKVELALVQPKAKPNQVSPTITITN